MTRRHSLAAFLLVTAAALAPAAQADPPTRTIANPEWLRAPTAEDLARYYPDRAQRAHVSGGATLTCLLTERGILGSCTVAESPPGFGFGPAAFKLGKLYKMRPVTRDGAPVAGALVRIPIAFNLPG